MRKVDIIRAWKDPLYRATLTAEELAVLPGHPSGVLELPDEQLRGITAAAETTAQTCTELSFNNFRRCCPR
jgi:mersacidin/lichenicidin family type 2 lantibiotic